MLTRRHLIAGAAAFPLATGIHRLSAQSATPAASPVPSAPSSGDIVPGWLDAQEALRALGQKAVEAFWNGDSATLLEMSDEAMTAALQTGIDPQELQELFVHDQVHFHFAEAGAWFYGRYSPENISGMFVQGGALSWEVEPLEPQSGPVPTGAWSGTIGPGVIDLGIRLDFSGDTESLAVNLTIPQQLVVDVPMSDVLFQEEIPIGPEIDERVLPAGGDVTVVNNYAAQYEWGNATLVVDSYWNGDGELAGLSLAPQAALPSAPDQEPITARLPFEGAWLTVWGGETEFRNYHATVPAQRYAADILLWQDGSTAEAPGTDNEHYHAFGQPYLSPVSGTVALVLDGLDDIPPQQPGTPTSNIAGNHIVIEKDGAFVFLAHCKNGSILVQEGDVVEAGEVVAAVGNSGNTSEPHIHIHAQASPDVFDFEAPGIPIVFENVLVNNELQETTTPLVGTIMEQGS